MNVSIKFSGLEVIAEAINNLARAMGASGVTASLQYKEAVDVSKSALANGSAETQMQQAAPMQQVAPVQQTAPVQQPVPVQQPAPAPAASGSYPAGMPAMPVQQQGAPVNMPGSPFPPSGGSAAPSPMTGPVPTTASAPAYTQDQIAVAMTGLVDQGKQPQVMQVLSQFGAGSLMQVPKEQYGALATQLRILGANL